MTSHIFSVPKGRLAPFFTWATPFALLLIFAAPAHSAITVSTETTVSSGATLDTLLPGDELTVDITVRSDGELTLALGLSANGYDPNILRLQSGNLRTDFLNQVCLAAIGCLAGINNLAAITGPVEDFSNPLGPTVDVARGVSFGVTNTGAVDEGVITGIAGDPQFQLVFLVVGMGSTTINIGSDPAYGDFLILPGGTTGIVNGSSIAITAMPEPGTATLLGLGLIGLARRTR